jgi:hypothetical protein
MGTGWLGPRNTAPSAEDIAAHWGEVCEKRGAVELASLMDEFAAVAKQLSAI